MKPEHRSLLAVALSVGVIALWYSVISPPPKGGTAEAPLTTATLAETGITTQTPTATATPTTSKAQNTPLVETTIEQDLYRATLTNEGGILTSWKLPHYHKTPDDKSAPINLVDAEQGAEGVLHLSFLDATFAFPEEPRFVVEKKGKEVVRYQWRSNEVEIVKTFTFHPGSYLIDVDVELINHTSRSLEARPFLRWTGISKPDADRNGFFSFLKPPSGNQKHPLFYVDGKVERADNLSKIAPLVEKGGSVYWAALEDRYFMTALIPRAQGAGVTARYGARDLPEAGAQAKEVEAGVALSRVVVAPGTTSKQGFTVYAGPKEINQLKGVGVRLEEAIDYGWFSFIAFPLLLLLKLFYGLVSNYGVAIILLTVFVKLLLHPFSKKSMKSMKAMQALQPKLKALQEKFKNDKARLQQETMQLFRTHKANPAGGCLPMLLQFPVYIALYKVLWNSIELYHAPFFWFYRDLSAPDPYLIGPILLGIFMVAQQKLMPSPSADPLQKKMMMMMPIMFSVFMIFLPAGLVIYILVNTVMSVTQQWMYNHDIRLRDLVRGKFPTSVKSY